MYPTVSEYDRIIRTKGENAFKTLKGLQFLPSRIRPAKIYTYGSGTFAVVFKATENRNTEVAIRCFIGGRHDYVNRYKHISEYLRNIASSWITKTELLEDEISVNGNLYPVIKMDWVEGWLINDYISINIDNNANLSSLQNQIIKLNNSKEKKQIGHGDIQFGNVIVDTNGKLKLIDYDGMYIPDFRGQKSIEKGRPEFQHPDRENISYDEKIDRFSFWVILCALEALKFDKSLWNKVSQGGFNTDENLLFTGGDFSDFRNSLLVHKLYQLNQGSVNFYLDKLNELCYSSPDAVSKPILFDGENAPISQPNSDALPDGKVKIISTPESFVLNQALKKIGKTPITLNRSDYLGKQLIISYGERQKTIRISPGDRIKEITFAEIKSSPGTKVTEPEIFPPKIHLFSVQPTKIRSGKTATLSWEVENAEEVKIFINNALFRNGIDLKGEESIKITLEPRDKKESDFKFRLEARNQLEKQVFNDTSVKVLKESNISTYLILAIGLIMAGFSLFWLYHNSFLNNNNKSDNHQLQVANETQSTAQPVQEPEKQSLYILSNNQIIDTLKQYYQDNGNRDLAAFENHFSYPIENYFGRSNIEMGSLASMVKHSWSIIQSSFNYPNFDSIQIDRKDGNYFISYPLEYDYSLKSGISYFNEYMNLIKLNSAGKINDIKSELIKSIVDSSTYFILKSLKYYRNKFSENVSDSNNLYEYSNMLPLPPKDAALNDTILYSFLGEDILSNETYSQVYIGIITDIDSTYNAGGVQIFIVQRLPVVGGKNDDNYNNIVTVGSRELFNLYDMDKVKNLIKPGKRVIFSCNRVGSGGFLYLTAIQGLPFY